MARWAMLGRSLPDSREFRVQVSGFRDLASGFGVEGFSILGLGVQGQAHPLSLLTTNPAP